jgi:membrane associated rhomboid family serine protease
MKDNSWTVLKLCGFFVAAFVYQVITGFDPSFEAGVSPWWKYFTSIVGHSGPEHLMNNLFFIGVFGTILELETDGRTVLNVFLLSALFANLSAFIFYPETGIIGASAGGTGILAALAVMKPNNVGLALGVPLPMWAVLPVYVLINLAGMPAETGIAYEAHLMGMLIGGVAGLYMRQGGNDSSYPGKKRGEPVDTGDQEEIENWEEKIRRWEEKYMK